jgi:hypothetical protein
MRHFYDMTNISISGRDLFAPSKLEDQPAVDWPLFADNTSGILARDKEAGYDLGKLADSLKNNSVVYHSPSEAALDDLLDRLQQFKLTKLEIGLFVCLGLLILAVIVLSVKVKRHGHTLHKMALMLLAVSKNIPMTEQFVLKNDMTRTASEAIQSWVPSPDHWTEWGPYWTNIGVLLVSLAVTMGCLKLALSRRAFVYVDLSNDTDAIELKLRELPTASRCYGLRTSQTRLRATLEDGWFGSRITFLANHWFYFHFTDNDIVALPTSLWLTPWTARKARRILRSDHRVHTFLVYTHHYIVYKQNNQLERQAHTASDTGLADGDDYYYAHESGV